MRQTVHSSMSHKQRKAEDPLIIMDCFFPLYLRKRLIDNENNAYLQAAWLVCSHQLLLMKTKHFLPLKGFSFFSAEETL